LTAEAFHGAQKRRILATAEYKRTLWDELEADDDEGEDATLERHCQLRR